LFALSTAISSANDKPTVASMNLCTDRLVLALADPEQIISLSYVAVDPFSMIETAPSNIALNHGRLEEMLILKTDYIFASEYDDPRVIDRLRQYGKTVEQLQAANSISEAQSNIRNMAELLGQPQRGEKMIKQLSSIVKSPKPKNKNRTIILGANNYISGQNSLSSHLIEMLGFKNIAAEANVTDYGQVSMEKIIDLQPDAIILNKYSDHYSRAQAVLQHPVLKHLSQHTKLYYVPTREWICGDTALVRAANRLM